MSRSEHTRTTTPSQKSQSASTPTTNPTPNPKDADELAKLDLACTRIGNAIPELPYALSCPVNVEPRYHYPSRQEAESWRNNTPFYPHEEGLQYMTYVYREPGESCFVVRSHVDEERERREVAEREKGRQQAQHLRNGSRSEVGSVSSTRPGTPTVGAGGGAASVAKKKISLSAYKEKVAGGKGDKKEQSPEKEVQPLKSLLEAKKQINGAKDELKMEDFEVKKEDMDALLPAGTKRPRESDVDKSGASADKPTSAKKPRLSPPPSVKAPRQPSPRPSLQPSAIDHPNGAPHGLPALLSPTNPFEAAEAEKPSPKPTTTPAKKKSSKWDLPKMLSPTLPPRIQAELAKERERGRPDSAASSPASKATRTPGSAARSPAITARHIGKIEESPSAKVKDGTKSRMKEVGSDDEGARSEKPKRLVVKLKYSKKLAYRVKSVLRAPPRPNRDKFPLDEDFMRRQRERMENRPIKSIANSLASKSRPRSTSDVDSPLQRPKKDGDLKKDRLHPDTARTSTKMPEKRPRQDDSESAPVTKKQKMPSNLDLQKEKDPKTPITSAIPSPSIQKSGGSVKDSITVTPRQGHLKTAATMARSSSQDSPVATPNGRPVSSTPLASSGSRSRPPTSAPSNTPATAPRAELLKALLDQSQKYNVLGRKLKYENQEINKQATKTEPERRRMALLGIECIMSYMLAYSLGDARRKAENKSAEIEASWKSLLPLYKHMRSFLGNYRPLDGLHAYLGITINARISAVAGERVMRAANAGVNALVAADSPQSTVTTSTSQDTAQIQMDNMRAHFEAVTAMTDATRDAAQKLPSDEIKSLFPDTFDKRSREPRGPSLESLLDRQGKEVLLEGSYWLPVGIDSAPVQAVRFGVGIVREWIRREELGYEPRIRI